LAIVAAQWEIDSISQFLREGGVIWDYLFSFYDFPANRKAEAKDIYKTLLYSLCFAFPPHKLRWWIQENFPGELPYLIGERFLQIPYINDLITGQKRALDEIVHASGAWDCYG
jgi:hypothetical protein